MSQSESAITNLSPQVTRRVPSGHPVIAWLVIGAVVVFVVYRNVEAEAKARERFDSVMFEWQARYIVGVADLLGQRNKALLGQAEALAGRSFQQRLRFAVLAGELAGPEEARQQLQALQAEDVPDLETVQALERIYAAEEQKPPQEPPVQAAKQVRDKLGWLGELATNPPGTADRAARAAVLAPARRTASVMLAGAGVGLAGVLIGVAVLALGILLAATDTVPPRLLTGSAYGGIYAETFAVWMALFVAFSFLFSFIPWGPQRFLAGGFVSLGSLGALAWPLLRGVPMSVLRYDIGWTGARPVDLLTGIGTYVAALPFLALGVMVTLILVAAAKRHGQPNEIIGHPLTPFILQAGWWGRVQAFVVASIVAPVVEETMFRGVLYRHVRESTATSGRLLSCGISALAVSFVFAVIHPQGWLGVPPLMGLAFAFCLAREWRNNLLGPMVAHAIQNTSILALVILAGS